MMEDIKALFANLVEALIALFNSLIGKIPTV